MDFDDYGLDGELEEYTSEDDVEMEQILPNTDDNYWYEILEADSVVTDMLKKISSVNTILQISSTTTRILLHHFKWDEEKLLEKFYSGNRAALFKEAHILDPEKGKKIFKPLSSPTEDCEICLSPLPSKSMTGLECGHRFCENCWDQYLTMKIMLEGECFTISCPAHKCDILVDDATAMALITNSKVRSKYQHLITESFVEFNRIFKWCPAADCGRAIKVQYISSKPVKCKCGYKFCFKCSEKWHAPILCDYLRKWKKKAAEDSATSAWIGLNTKDCPKCYALIEKNGGCNHMSCKKCKYEFCWICSVDWSKHHTSYSCNRFQEADELNKGLASAKSALKKYLFYCDRYMNHMKSLELEKNLQMVVEKKMKELQAFNMSWAEVQFLMKAVNSLSQSRETLMYSYAFAYYLEKCNQKVIFEANQKDLENATETLSHYLEQDIENEELDEIKRKVQDKFHYCEQRSKVLLDHVNEGYEKGWWKHLNII